ncbi:MAG: hypothetical protein H0W50_07440 [Parachlamydiaceae bacterium]|nr:hypothetical protein [Parachlamydiaceae bacterium]
METCSSNSPYVVNNGFDHYGLNENIPPKNRFLSELHSKIDSYIGKEIFVPLWTAILRDCEVKEWISEGEHTFRLILDSAYQAEPKFKHEQTFLIEKEIVIKIIPESKEIIFPHVKFLFENKKALNPKQKELNAIWGWAQHFGCIFTGVGYTQRWDNVRNRIINDNINDAAQIFQPYATPIIFSLQDTIKQWNERGRQKIGS